MASTNTTSIKTTCCVVGGGPAGMMLGFLLARAGVKVAVLEKHADFLRDFRGDTIHPSTLQLMHELGLLEDFLKLPHSRVDHLCGQIGATRITVADFTHLPTVCKYIALMPQWDFLDFIADARQALCQLRPAHAHRSHRPDRGGRPRRRRARQRRRRANSKSAPISWSAPTAGIRPCANAPASKSTAWARPWTCCGSACRARKSDETETFGHVEAGRMLIMLNRTDYWQCAYLIPKDGYAAVKAAGLDAFRAAWSR